MVLIILVILMFLHELLFAINRHIEKLKNVDNK